MQDDFGSSYMNVRLEWLDERELMDVATRLFDECGPECGDVILARIKSFRETRDLSEMERWMQLLNLVEHLNGRGEDALH